MRGRIIGVLIGAAVIAATFGHAALAAGMQGVKVPLRASDARDAPIETEVQLYGASYALVVGIDEYTAGWPRLSNAVKDAKLIAAALKKKGFDVTLALNPKSSELKDVLEEFFIIKGEDPDARLFVWFAGHGHTEGGEGFIIPADAPRPNAGAKFRLKALSLRRIGEYVRLAVSKHSFTIFDSCFSGTVFDSARALPPAAITRATTLPVRQFLTSGDAGQTVSDDGTFRELFLRALSGEEKADANGDGFVTASEIGLFLTDRITNLTEAKQTPRYGKLRDKDWDRGDFVFALPQTRVKIAAKSSAGGVDVAVQQDMLFWQSIQNTDDPALIEAYLQKYPGGAFSGLANAKLASLQRKQAAGQARARSLAEQEERQKAALDAERKRLQEVVQKQLAAAEAKRKTELDKERELLRQERQKLAALTPSPRPESRTTEGQSLTGAQIKALLADNPVEGRTRKGHALTMDFRADGDLNGEVENGQQDVGKWWIDRDVLCRQWEYFGKGKKKCFRLVVTGDDEVTIFSARHGAKITEWTVPDARRRLAALAPSGQAPAMSIDRFDGTWNITVSYELGSTAECHDVTPEPFTVKAGKISGAFIHPQDTVDFIGTIDPAGNAKAIFEGAFTRGNSTGQFSDTKAIGKFNLDASEASLICTGVWEAEKIAAN